MNLNFSLCTSGEWQFHLLLYVSSSFYGWKSIPIMHAKPPSLPKPAQPGQAEGCAKVSTEFRCQWQLRWIQWHRRRRWQRHCRQPLQSSQEQEQWFWSSAFQKERRFFWRFFEHRSIHQLCDERQPHRSRFVSSGDILDIVPICIFVISQFLSEESPQTWCPAKARWSWARK